MSTFQENLKKYREGLNINAKDFAALIGVNYSTYSNYENQGREPKYDTLCKIAAALHVSIDDLLGYEKEQRGIDYWKAYLADTTIRFLDSDGENITVLIGGDNALKAYEYEKVHGIDGVTKAVFTESDLLNLLEASRGKAKETEKKLVANALYAVVFDRSKRDFMESLKELESYRE